MQASNSLLRSWALLFAILLLGVSAVILPVLLKFENAREELILEREGVQLAATEDVIRSVFRERLGDIKVLTTSQSIRRYLSSEAEPERAGIVQVFEAFCRAYGQYDQIRLIQSDGQELYRVNYAEGECLSAPHEELQNRSHHNYFREAMKLYPGGLYISPFDFNAENGDIKKPHMPTILFASPVTGKSGEVKGLLVMNYLAANLLDQLYPQLSYGDSGKADTYNFLLNEQGYYLKSEKSPQREFGFLSGREEERFGRDYPSVWRALEKGERVIRTSDGVFLAKSLNISGGAYYGTAVYIMGNSVRQWYAVRLLTNENFNKTSLLFGPQRVLWFGGYLLTLALISFLLAERRQYNKKFFGTMEEMQNTMEGVNNAEVMMHWVDYETGDILHVNSCMEKLLGFSQRALLKKQIWDIVHTFTAEHFQRLRERIARAGHINIEMTYLRKGGTQMPVDLAIGFRPATALRPAHFVIVAKDISDRKKVELEKEKSKAALAEAQEIAKLGNWELDIKKSSLTWSDEVFRIFEIDPEDFTASYENFEETVHPEDRERVNRDYEDSVKNKTDFEIEHRLLMRDGRIKYVVEKGYTTYNNRGAPVRSIGTVQDITDRKLIEIELDEKKQNLLIANQTLESKVEKRTAQLKEALARAQEATKAKGQFLANMSHEIRTPMGAIIGMTHLALETDQKEKRQRYIREAHKSAKNLLVILNDILDFSKVEAGKVDLEIVDFSISEVIADMTSLVKVKADEKNIHFTTEVSPRIPEVMAGDPLRIGQILINLVSNAIKFTPDGGSVSVSTSLSEENSEGLLLHFTVTDTGIGISPENQQKLFRAFSQADASTTRQFGGTGLGLTISKKLVDLMGGKIWVESLEGQGSSFHFTIWVKKSLADGGSAFTHQEGKNRDEYVQQLRGAHILVVDDNPVNQILAVELLNMYGMSAETAENGKEALELLEKTKFDGVLMDCQMPVMDGYETTLQIRKRECGKDLLVIALTANAMVEEKDKVLAVGMNDCLTKPIDVDQMLQTLAKYIRSGSNPGK